MEESIKSKTHRKITYSLLEQLGLKVKSGI